MEWLALIGLSLASFVTAVDFAIVNTALPAIQKSLALTTTELQWVMNIFVLTICIFMATMGRVSDIYGHKLILYSGVILFGISSLIAGLATTAIMLIFCRALQGLSVAIIIPSSLALISVIFAEGKRGKAIGIWTSINGIGMALGPALGGIIVSSLSWRWIFFINIPFVALSLFLCSISIRQKITKKAETVDWWGCLFLAICIASLVFALINGNTWSWFSAKILLLFIVAIVSFIIFFQIEKYQTYPLLNFSLFQNKGFFAASIANFLILFFAYTLFFLAPLYLQNIRELYPYIVGLMLLPISAMVIIISPYGGYLYDSYGAKLPICLGMILFCFSALLQSLINLGSSYFFIAISFGLMGIGWGLSAGPASAAGIAALPKNFSGIASGALWTIRNLGGSIGLAFAGIIFQLQSKKYIFQQFSLANIHITTTQQSQLTAHLSSPQIILSLLNLKNVNTNDIISILKHGFIDGYQTTMLFLTLISLFAFVAIMLLIPNNKKSIQ